MELGIPGALFYLAALLCMLAAFFKNFRFYSMADLIPYAAAGSYFVQSLVGNTHYYTTCFFVVVLGFAWRASYEATLRRTQPPLRSAQAQ